MGRSFLSSAEALRLESIRDVPRSTRAANGQFLTPEPVARFMAGLFSHVDDRPIKLLDPGAGAGALTFAFIDALLAKEDPPPRTQLVAIESDRYFASQLAKSADAGFALFPEVEAKLSFTLIEQDFIEYGVSQLAPALGATEHSPARFTHAILNPPYYKLSPSSNQRKLLTQVGIDAPNMYAAFVALALALLQEGGELVAITPRSFCNGPYFRRFRHQLYRVASFKSIHVFHSRDRAFKDDNVLQENVIFHLKKSLDRGQVRVSSSADHSFANSSDQLIPHQAIIAPSDPDLVIRVPANGFDIHVLERVSCLPHRLKDLGLTVSTGPVVDFRLADSIERELLPGSAPLIYPSHIDGNLVAWPRQKGHKPGAIRVNASTAKWLLPNEPYVIVRRFSAKEEKRRIYPAFFSPLPPGFSLVGFENHLNIIRGHTCPLEPRLAKGLVAYLASTIVDLFFRQFSGHTQVNAADIHAIPLPPIDMLNSLSGLFHENVVRAEAVDQALEHLFTTRYRITSPDPTGRL